MSNVNDSDISDDIVGIYDEGKPLLKKNSVIIGDKLLIPTHNTLYKTLAEIPKNNVKQGYHYKYFHNNNISCIKYYRDDKINLKVKYYPNNIVRYRLETCSVPNNDDVIGYIHIFHPWGELYYKGFVNKSKQPEYFADHMNVRNIVYTGQIKDGAKHGYGMEYNIKRTIKHEISFSGYFNMNKRHGSGLLYKYSKPTEVVYYQGKLVKINENNKS